MLRIALIAVAILVAVWVLNDDRGVPLAALILVGFCLFFFYVTTRTTFGRHIFAVGGNAEAARRAGIHVTRVRVIVFVISSTMAAVGGDHGGIAAPGGEPVVRRRGLPAAGDRRTGDRGHQPVRRPRAACGTHCSGRS